MRFEGGRPGRAACPAPALAHRCGGRKVTTVEVDPAVSRHARQRPAAAGSRPEAVVGDGAKGCAGGAPYDRVLATVGLREIPGAWIQQTRPGGLIVAPWGTHYTPADAVARLMVREDGTASGRFTGPVEFMKLRGRRLSPPPHHAYVPAGGEGGADTSTTGIPEGEFITPPYAALPFVLGSGYRIAAGRTTPSAGVAGRSGRFLVSVERGVRRRAPGRLMGCRKWNRSVLVTRRPPGRAGAVPRLKPVRAHGAGR
ncbi:hypothetical protein [Streptomyces sp. 6N106]|uniref:hypothetical protein n=1 Tax=Streptomyces sp. 6N106 TaxID=3457418 RepID=UPI003FD13D43